MTTPEELSAAEVRAREVLEYMTTTLRAAAEAVTGNPEDSPLEVFPEPGERRADTEFSLPEDREATFRQAMAELGIGRETNRDAEEAGLCDGYIAVIEGGQAHKMLAEVKVAAEGTVQPGMIIMSAAAERKLPPVEEDKVNERTITAKVLDIDVDAVRDTEYEVAKQVIGYVPGFTRIQPQDLPFGYEVVSGEVTAESTGQVQEIGTLNNVPVVMLRIDREYYQDGEQTKYHTLDTGKALRVIDKILRATGNAQADIGFVTSATYLPSRQVDAVRSELVIARQGNDRKIGVVAYGTAELAAAKREAAPSQPSLGQLAGEAHKAARQVLELESAL